MTPEEITALAREYAEENGSHTRLFTTVVADTEELIRFLLRRYCLVEKSKVRQLKQCFGSEEVYEVIDMLFPDLGKEVES